jgi:hypothetical protein
VMKGVGMMCGNDWNGVLNGVGVHSVDWEAFGYREV